MLTKNYVARTGKRGQLDWSIKDQDEDSNDKNLHVKRTATHSGVTDVDLKRNFVSCETKYPQ